MKGFYASGTVLSIFKYFNNAHENPVTYTLVLLSAFHGRKLNPRAGQWWQ